MAVLEENLETINMVRDSAAAVTGEGLSRVRSLRFKRPGFDRSVWRTMGELGWIGLRTPVESGGAGLGMREYCALVEKLGSDLVPEPLVSGVLAASLLPVTMLSDVLSGQRIVLPAWQEWPSSLDSLGTTRFADGRLNGCKRYIVMADGADAFLVVTQTGLALVERGANGTICTTEPTQDGGYFGTLMLDNCAASTVPGDLRRFSGAVDEAVLASAAYLLGLMERAFEISLDYLRTRTQFGRSLSNFQALQHRAVDLKIQIALSRASIENAAAVLDGGAPADLRSMLVSRAKCRATDAALLVARQAVQFHGAIGYTDEADPGLYLRKAMVVGNMFGSAIVHRRRYARVAPEAVVE